MGFSTERGEGRGRQRRGCHRGTLYPRSGPAQNSKPPFHHLNGRRQYFQRSNLDSPHLEVTKYIQDSWKNICREMEGNRSCAAEGKVPSVSYYSSNMTDEQLPRPDFKPFDLDAFLERRSLSLQAAKQQSQ